MAAAFRCLLGAYQLLSDEERLGALIAAGAAAGFAQHLHTQTAAWITELDVLGTMVAHLLKSIATSTEWSLLLEYEIPRRANRPDALLLAGDLIFVIEFKVGGEAFSALDRWQVRNYALDIRDFHHASSGRRIVPVLVATEAELTDSIGSAPLEERRDLVRQIVLTNRYELPKAIEHAFNAEKHDASDFIDPEIWDHSAYRPTPTIIEAAEQLFAGHNVKDISHSFATNLTETTDEIVRVIDAAQKDKSRTICFVTGSPGAGKTLAGLNAAHDPKLRSDGRPPAVFLSGNGPLVKIVREALVRDRQGRGEPRAEARRVVSTFIGNVHGFLTHYGIDERNQIPSEHAIVFDEAQRAWNADAVRKKHPDVHRSEPDLILDIMERAPDWCVVVAIVGNGQEIHQGEAGLEEWGHALRGRSSEWKVIAAPTLLDSSKLDLRIFDSPPPANITSKASSALHLTTSVRSPRAALLGQSVDALISNRSVPWLDQGNVLDKSEFPIAVTRSLTTARSWLRAHADGLQRLGLLASSGALRLRAHGIEISSGFRQSYPYTDWFLSRTTDTRSSNFLEVAATEFECQGLELDWSCVCWGGDFIMSGPENAWQCRKFRGTKWQSVRKADQRQYIVNKYRVLLTRARFGMVIWIPSGDPNDPSRDPEQFDATAKHLLRAGLPLI